MLTWACYHTYNDNSIILRFRRFNGLSFVCSHANVWYLTASKDQQSYYDISCGERERLLQIIMVVYPIVVTFFTENHKCKHTMVREDKTGCEVSRMHLLGTMSSWRSTCCMSRYVMSEKVDVLEVRKVRGSPKSPRSILWVQVLKDKFTQIIIYSLRCCSADEKLGEVS